MTGDADRGRIVEMWDLLRQLGSTILARLYPETEKTDLQHFAGQLGRDPVSGSVVGVIHRSWGGAECSGNGLF